MPLSSNGYSPHWCLVLSGGNSWQEPNKPRHTTSPHGGLLVTGSWSGHIKDTNLMTPDHDTLLRDIFLPGISSSWHPFSHGLSSISWPPISRTPPSRILPVSWSYPCHGGKTRPHDIQEQDTRPRDRGSVKIKDLSPWYWWSFLEPHGGCKVRKGPKVAKFLDR